MSLYLTDEDEVFADPMDLVEAIIESDVRFSAERADDGDVQFTFAESPGDVAGYFSYREELPALMFTLGFDLLARDQKLAQAMRLAALINENLWIGHFDIWSEDGSIVFRHALPMIGRDEVSAGEVHALLAAALDAVERFYPAFKSVVADGLTAELAAEIAMFEVAGEA